MNRNKVLKLGVNDEDIFPGPHQGGEITVLRVGKPIGAKFVWEHGASLK